MNRVGLIFLLLFSLALPTSAEPRKLDLLAAGPAQQAESTPIRDKWALVIGISKFANPAINLRYPSKDAQDFAQFLISKQGFAPDHVKVLTDSAATRVNILTAIGGNFLPRRVLPDDLVIIFISTHGSQPDVEVEGVNYIVAYDTDVNNLYASGIAMQDLGRLIKGKVHTNRIVMFVDACHSGTVNPEGKGLVRNTGVNTAHLLEGAGQIVISSSKPNQVSWESKHYQNSVFTHRLMEALSANNAQVTINTAFDMMKNKVEEEVAQDRGNLQEPEMKSRWLGSPLVISVAPANPRTVPPLPDEDIDNAEKETIANGTASGINGERSVDTTATHVSSIGSSNSNAGGVVRFIDVFGRESAFLGGLAGYTADVGANDPSAAHHASWASTRSRKTVTENLLLKYTQQYDRQCKISEQSGLKFYGEASARLASYGIDLGDPGSNSTDPRVHVQWGARNTHQKLRSEIARKVRIVMAGAE